MILNNFDTIDTFEPVYKIDTFDTSDTYTFQN